MTGQKDRRKRETYDTDFAVRHGLAGFNAFLAATDPQLALWNMRWEAEVEVAKERLVMQALTEILLAQQAA